LPSVIALIVVFLSLIIPVSLIFVFFGALIFSQLTELIDQIPVLWDNLVTWAKQQRPELERFFKTNSIGKSISEAFKSPGGPVAAIADYLMESAVHAGATIISGIVTFMGWVILPVYLAFFLLMPKLRPDSLTTDHLPFLKPETAADAIYLAKEFVQLVVVFFRGQILIALIQGILFAIGFSLAGLKYGAVLGLMLGFLNIVPYLGSMVGLSVCLPMAWFQAGGGSTTLALVIAVFTIVQAIEGYFLTPKIMGDRTGLNPLVIIVGIFFWGAALNGILGMILAIPLTAFLVVLWRLAREKYIGQMF
jgi:predicted PurR-regulated permease PerM